MDSTNGVVPETSSSPFVSFFFFCGMSLNTYSTLAVLGKDVAKGWWTLLAHKACRLPYAANSRAQVHKRVDVIAWRFYSPAYFSVLISPSIDFTYPDTTKATNLATKKKKNEKKKTIILTVYWFHKITDSFHFQLEITVSCKFDFLESWPSSTQLFNLW